MIGLFPRVRVTPYHLRLLEPAGTADNLSFAAIAVGCLLLHPYFDGWLVPWFSATLGMLGGAWWGRRLAETFAPPVCEPIDGDVERDRLEIRSDPVPSTRDGIHLGYVVDHGQPLVIPDHDWTRHCMIVGQTGVGKTVLGLWIMHQQIERGGGLLWIDGKLDAENLSALIAMCAVSGRLHDLRVISPGTPLYSNTYNPVLYGDPDEVASRIMSMIPTSEGHAGSDYYYQSASQGLTTLLSAIQEVGLAYNCADLGILLMHSGALEDLLARCPKRGHARHELARWLHQFRDAHGAINTMKMKDVFGGVGGRLLKFGHGAFGQVLNTYAPEVILHEDILANRIVYVALPTMGKQVAAVNFGKIMIGDLRSAIAKIQSLESARRPNPPFLCFTDEAGSYMTTAWARAFEQARSANVILVPAVQTKANLESIDRELQTIVTGNTQIKAFFRPGDPETAEWMSRIVGNEMSTVMSVSGSLSSSSSRPNTMILSQIATGARSGAQGFAEHATETPKITPSEFYRLAEGECIVVLRGSLTYHLRVPLITHDARIRQWIEHHSAVFVPPRITRPYREGLHYTTMPGLADEDGRKAHDTRRNGEEGEAPPMRRRQGAVARQRGARRAAG